MSNRWRLIDDAPTISHSETASVDFINAEVFNNIELLLIIYKLLDLIIV